jgi:hypothetical protein
VVEDRSVVEDHAAVVDRCAVAAPDGALVPNAVRSVAQNEEGDRCVEADRRVEGDRGVVFLNAVRSVAQIEVQSAVDRFVVARRVENRCAVVPRVVDRCAVGPRVGDRCGVARCAGCSRFLVGRACVSRHPRAALDALCERGDPRDRLAAPDASPHRTAALEQAHSYSDYSPANSGFHSYPHDGSDCRVSRAPRSDRPMVSSQLPLVPCYVSLDRCRVARVRGKCASVSDLHRVERPAYARRRQ